jgi:hypothetical protein
MPGMTSVCPPPDRGGCASVAGGLWMLLGGVAGAVGLVWQGNVWVVALPAYIAVVGALLLLEPLLLRRKAPGPAKVLTLPGAIVTVREGPEGTEPPGVIPQTWRMPIWMHLILQVVLTVSGFFGGAILGFCTAAPLLVGLAALFRSAEGQPEPPGPGGWGSALGGCCSFAIGAPLFFGGAALGGGQVQRLWLQYVTARCPKCGGGAYCKLGRPITYHCRSCGHVHATKVYTK